MYMNENIQKELDTKVKVHSILESSTYLEIDKEDFDDFYLDIDFDDYSQ